MHGTDLRMPGVGSSSPQSLAGGALDRQAPRAPEIAAACADSDQVSLFSNNVAIVGGVDLRAPGAGRVHVLRSTEGPLAIHEPFDEEETDLVVAVIPSPLGKYFPEADWADELVHLLSQWGAGADDGDENGDGMVDVDDLMELLEDR